MRNLTDAFLSSTRDFHAVDWFNNLTETGVIEKIYREACNIGHVNWEIILLLPAKTCKIFIRSLKLQGENIFCIFEPKATFPQW